MTLVGGCHRCGLNIESCMCQTAVLIPSEDVETVQGWLRQLDLDKKVGRVKHAQGNLQVSFSDDVLYNDMLRAFMSERASDFSGRWERGAVTVRGTTAEYKETFVVCRIS